MNVWERLPLVPVEGDGQRRRLVGGESGEQINRVTGGGTETVQVVGHGIVV